MGYDLHKFQQNHIKITSKIQNLRKNLDLLQAKSTTKVIGITSKIKDSQLFNEQLEKKIRTQQKEITKLQQRRKGIVPEEILQQQRNINEQLQKSQHQKFDSEDRQKNYFTDLNIGDCRDVEKLQLQTVNLEAQLEELKVEQNRQAERIAQLTQDIEKQTRSLQIKQSTYKSLTQELKLSEKPRYEQKEQRHFKIESTALAMLAQVKQMECNNEELQNCARRMLQQIEDCQDQRLRTMIEPNRYELLVMDKIATLNFEIGLTPMPSIELLNKKQLLEATLKVLQKEHEQGILENMDVVAWKEYQ